MNNSIVLQIASVSAVSVAALMCSAGAIAAPSQNALEVLSNRAAVANIEMPAHARAGSGISGTLDEDALSASALEFALSDGRDITARLQRVARDSQKRVQSWIGTFDGLPGSLLVLSNVGGVITGFANVGNETFEIIPKRDGRHLLYAVDSRKLPAMAEPEMTPSLNADTTTDAGGGFGLGASTLAAGDAIVHDVLVVYTAAAAAAYGQATLESMIQSAVQSANQAYLNSQVGITMNLVAAQQVAITEGATMADTRNVLKSDPSVAGLRDRLGADIVMLVSQNSDNCGLAAVMLTNSTSFAPYAFGVVYSSCLSNQSLAHEVGHTQGLMHDRSSSSASGVYPYSYGYRVCASDGTGFRDIMSYPCSGAPRVLVFSNPSVNWNGYPSGIAYESDPANSAENARTLNNTATTVAAFRSSRSAGTAPFGPTGLASQSVAYNSVTVGWTDNASNETGFKVERSSDGVNFAEISTVGVDTRSYVDVTVVSRASYYYRVRAYNSFGASGYSNAVGVTIPDAPPPPPAAPTSVTALDGTDGSAIVSWIDAATTESGFEVSRAKWDTRKSIWSSAVLAATVPSGVSSIADVAGTGTYRYFVSAINSGGRSALAGPASVTVTNMNGNGAKKTSPGKGR